MEEKEIDKILKPQKKIGVLVGLLFIYLGIATICIGLVFFMKYKKQQDPLELSELIANNSEQEGQYVQIDIAYLPKILQTNSDADYYFYYAEDIENRAYMVKLSNETYRKLYDITNKEDGKLTEIYHLEGVTYNIDFDEIKSNSISKVSGKVYIHENKTTEREITLYSVLALFGVFFLILALGYIVPGIIKARKVLKDKELISELRVELENLTDTPYKKQNIYLTKNYIIAGIEVVKYEDIVCIYIKEETKYGMKIGQNLVIETKDGKKHTIGSVIGTKNEVLSEVLMDIKRKNTDIKDLYNEEQH